MYKKGDGLYAKKMEAAISIGSEANGSLFLLFFSVAVGGYAAAVLWAIFLYGCHDARGLSNE
ncbi:MAG: hypothetical protein SOX25_10375 [Eubacteriales bacterium]|nr:hypothetical protein [Eubacteriales bacterium]